MNRTSRTWYTLSDISDSDYMYLIYARLDDSRDIWEHFAAYIKFDEVN